MECPVRATKGILTSFQLRKEMIVELSVILDSMCMLVEGRERQCKKDVPSSREQLAQKPWERKEHSTYWGLIEARCGWNIV